MERSLAYMFDKVSSPFYLMLDVGKVGGEYEIS